jgi:hypothetical protein
MHIDKQTSILHMCMTEDAYRKTYWCTNHMGGLFLLKQASEGTGSSREDKDILGRRRTIWWKAKSTGAN